MSYSIGNLSELESGDIVVIKLFSSEEIIATYVGGNDHDGSTLIFENIHSVQIIPIPQTQQAGLQLTPVMIYAKNQKLEIFSDSISMIAEPDDNLLNRYREIFSKIQIAKSIPKNIILE